MLISRAFLPHVSARVFYATLRFRRLPSPHVHLGASMTPIKRFLRDESGATAIEYGLIAAGISVAILTVVNNLGGQLKNTFSKVSTQLGNAGK
jgi:pilus assembly protein Flp/PilA